MNFTFHYLRDEEIGEELDLRLRALLLECFPHEAHHLKHKRYFHEWPGHRWLAFAENGELAAHVAAHHKLIRVGEEELKVLGIAEVGVSPAYRGQGLVKALLRDVHAWGAEHGYLFAALLGSHRIYSSSGYVNSDQFVTYYDVTTMGINQEKLPYLMVRALGKKAWPEGNIDLRGPLF